MGGISKVRKVKVRMPGKGWVEIDPTPHLFVSDSNESQEAIELLEKAGIQIELYRTNGEGPVLYTRTLFQDCRGVDGIKEYIVLFKALEKAGKNPYDPWPEARGVEKEDMIIS